MSMFKNGGRRGAAAALLLALLAGCGSIAPDKGFGLGLSLPVARLNIGEEPRPEQIRAWDIDVRADGAGLPPGAGSVVQGQALYQEQCLSCHGAKGVGATAPKLVGGQGTLAGNAPVQTIGSYWPYATTLYDYINRAMPLNKPQSLKPDEVYALSAYLLNLNGIVKADTVLDARSLPKVKMPNRNGFRPEWN